MLRVPDHLVLLDWGLGCAATVLCRDGRGEVPFHIAGAADKGYVVEINDLCGLAVVRNKIRGSGLELFPEVAKQD